MKNKYVAIFFAFFGGVLGLHKMYLNGFSKGSTRLVLFFLAVFLKFNVVFVILGIIGAIEGILMAAMSDESFDEKYNKGKSAANPSSQTPRPRRKPGGFFASPAKWLKSGDKKFKDYDLQGALEDFKKAEEIAPNNPVVHFNLACTYSMTEDAARGFYHLEKAVVSGLKDRSIIADHESLAFLRIQPQFPAFAANGYKMTGIKALGEGDSFSLLDQLKQITEQRERGELSDLEFNTLKEKLMR